MKYAKISNKRRKELIERVAINGESISKVSRMLGINTASAKSIVRTYKKKGIIFDKKMSKKAKRQVKREKQRNKYRSKVKIEESEEKVQIQPKRQELRSQKQQIKKEDNEQKLVLKSILSLTATRAQPPAAISIDMDEYVAASKLQILKSSFMGLGTSFVTRNRRGDKSGCSKLSMVCKECRFLHRNRKIDLIYNLL